MSEPIVFIDRSEIREGKLEELKTAMKELAEFVEANEPRTIAYDVYFDEAGSRVTVVQVHPDSASMEFHMKAAGHLFPRFADLLELVTMDVYGEPSEELLGRLRQKTQMLGVGSVVVHQLHAGFARFGTD
jgi:quinol monooxygenase YgiN